MKALLAPLAELADYEEIRKNRTKENGMIQISGLCKYSEDTFA